MRSTLVSAVLAFALLAGANNAFGGNYVRVSPDLEIYYEEAGSGRPIIFIPGWTGTTVVVVMLATASFNYILSTVAAHAFATDSERRSKSASCSGSLGVSPTLSSCLPNSTIAASSGLVPSGDFCFSFVSMV